MRLLTDEEGATATEYGILMSFIVMLTAIGISFFGLELLGWFDDLTAHLKLVLGIP
ncbi:MULTISPECIES: Flp family type IVb pilin [unclassified Pseudarthrobacter]|uniref:Flp family type IVb pilin n=1 Tax=unclassified Pseudarthrobacter TaxID=2647000 RepID=UPI003076D937